MSHPQNISDSNNLHVRLQAQLLLLKVIAEVFMKKLINIALSTVIATQSMSSALAATDTRVVLQNNTGVGLDEAYQSIKQIDGKNIQYGFLGVSDEEASQIKTKDLVRFARLLNNESLATDSNFVQRAKRIKTDFATLQRISAADLNETHRISTMIRSLTAQAMADFSMSQSSQWDRQVYKRFYEIGTEIEKSLTDNQKSALGIKAGGDFTGSSKISKVAMFKATAEEFARVSKSDNAQLLAQRMRDLQSLSLKYFQTPQARASYDLAMGKRGSLPVSTSYLFSKELRQAARDGYTVLRVQNPKTRKYELVRIKVFDQSDVNIKVSDFFNKTTATQIGLSTGIYAVGLLAFSYMSLYTSASESPAAFESALKKLLHPAMLGSILTMSLANQATQAALAPIHLNLVRIQQLQEMGIMTGSPAHTMMAKQLIASSPLPAFLATFAAYTSNFSINQFAACQSLVHDKKMSGSEKSEAIRLCDSTYLDFLKSYSPQMVLMALSMMATQKIMFLAGNYKYLAASNFSGFGLLKTGSEAALDDAAKFYARLSEAEKATKSAATVAAAVEDAGKVAAGASRGVSVTVNFLKGLGGFSLQMAAFTVLMDVTQRLLTWTASFAKTDYDYSKAKANLFHLDQKMVASGYSEEGYCGKGGFYKGEGPDLNKCSTQVMDSFNKIGEISKGWRNAILAPISQRLSVWQQYFSKAVNVAKMSEIFYKDIVTQIKLYRKDKTSMNLNPVMGTGYLAAKDYVRFAFEPLPLFRSSPLFGVRPEFIDDVYTDHSLSFKLEPRWLKQDEKSEALLKAKIQSRLNKKMITFNGVEQWLNGLKLGSVKQTIGKTEFEKISALIQSKNLDFEAKLENRVQALILINESLKKYAALTNLCKLGDVTPVCLINEINFRLSDALLSAADYLIERKRKNLLSPLEKKVVDPIIEGFWSRSELKRAAALKALLTFNQYSTISTNHFRCTEETLLTSDSITVGCSLQAAQYMIDRQSDEQSYLPQKLIMTEVYRILKFAPFNYRVNSDFGGYTNRLGQMPYGASPLAPGHKFIMNYFKVLEATSIDAEVFPNSIAASPTVSVGRFLALSTLCGPSSIDDKSAVVFRKVGFSPQFLPPRLPLKGSVDLCTSASDVQAPQNVYHQLRNLRNGETYNGIVEALFKLVDEQKLNSVDQWWSEKALSPLQTFIINESKVAYTGSKVLGVKTSSSIPDLYRSTLNGQGGILVKIPQAITRSDGLPSNYHDFALERIDYMFKYFYNRLPSDTKMMWNQASLISYDYGSDGLPRRVIKNYGKDPNLLKKYPQILQQEMRAHVSEAIRNAVDNPELAKVSIKKAMVDLAKLRGLLNVEEFEFNVLFKALFEPGFNKPYLSDYYPSLNFSNYPQFGYGNDITAIQSYYSYSVNELTELIMDLYLNVIPSADRSHNIVQDLLSSK